MSRSSTRVHEAKRGRPAAAVYSAVEVAELLDVEPGVVMRALSNPAFRKETFPNATETNEGWKIPARDVRALMGPDLPRLYWVSEFAQLIGYSVPYLNELLDKGVIGSRMVLGSRRVPATEYWKLPQHRPSAVRKRPTSKREGKAAPPPLSFFPGEGGATV